MASEGGLDDSVTNDDDFDDELVDALDDDDIEDQRQSANLDEGLPTKELINYQTKFTTKEQSYLRLYKGEYQTTQRLTKYERAKILGYRAAQIASGAPTLVDVGDLRDARAIAQKELEQGKIPFLIQRPLPGKTLKKPRYEVRRVKDLIL